MKFERIIFTEDDGRKYREPIMAYMYRTSGRIFRFIARGFIAISASGYAMNNFSLSKAEKLVLFISMLFLMIHYTPFDKPFRSWTIKESDYIKEENDE